MTPLVHSRLLPVSSFIDEGFDLNRLNDYVLSAILGFDGVKATVLDKVRNKYIAFEYISFQNVFDSPSLAEVFNNALNDSRILSQRYKQATFLIENNYSTLVPEPLFEPDRLKNYLNFNVPLQGDEEILFDSISALNARNVYAIPAVLKSAVDRAYAKVSYHHFSSSLIEGLMQQSKNIIKKQLFVHVQASHFEVIVIEGKKLLFYNSFYHHSAEDLVYYLMFVCEQLHLNPETIDLLLLGEIEKNSSVHNLILKYIRNVKFQARIESAELCYQLQTLPKHSYFTLFNNYLIK